MDASGNVYVTDLWYDSASPAIYQGRIQKFDGNGALLTQWSTNAPDQRSFPAGLGFGAGGRVYVADMLNRSVKVYSPTGDYLTQWGMPSIPTVNGPNVPTGVAVDALGNVYVADSSCCVLKFSGDGDLLAQWSTSGAGDDQFGPPHDVAVSADGKLYVTEGYANRIQLFTDAGVYQSQWGAFGSGDGQFTWPYGLAVGLGGYVCATDVANDRIQVFTSSGTYVTQWGTSGTANGQFHSPVDVAIDVSGNIYVADAGNRRIQKFGPAGLAVGPEVRSPQLQLAPPNPNPSSTQTTLRFSLRREADATLTIYDVNGRNVARWQWLKLAAGEHQVTWNGQDEDGRAVPPGVLFSRLSAEGQTESRRLIHLE